MERCTKCGSYNKYIGYPCASCSRIEVNSLVADAYTMNQRWFGGDNICEFCCKKCPSFCSKVGFLFGIVVAGVGVGVIATKGEGTSGGTVTGIVLLVIGLAIVLWACKHCRTAAPRENEVPLV